MNKPVCTCPHCGEQFTKLKDGKIPTHDFPRPCRQVCPGSNREPKRKADTPLWKDDPMQEARDIFDGCRLELLIYGFAIVKNIAQIGGQRTGETQCPLCLQKVQYSIAESNGHCAAKCITVGCISAME